MIGTKRVQNRMTDLMAWSIHRALHCDRPVVLLGTSLVALVNLDAISAVLNKLATNKNRRKNEDH